MNGERTVDAALAEELASRHVSADAIVEALEEYPEKEARSVLNWADSTGEAEKALGAWGRKRGASRDRERRREVAARGGRRLALEGTLRTTFRKLQAAEYLAARREKALAGASHKEEIQKILDGGSSTWDGERIRYETAALKASCAEQYPPEMLETRMGLDSAVERELERRVSEGCELTRDERLKVEAYRIASEALVSELREQVAFLEERLREVLPELGTGYYSSVYNDIRKLKGLPYEPLESDR